MEPVSKIKTEPAKVWRCRPDFPRSSMGIGGPVSSAFSFPRKDLTHPLTHCPVG